MNHLPKFKQLKIFQETIACGSINAASKKMNLSQPALTHALKELESVLDATLIIRSKDGVMLTKEGRAFSAYADLILKEIEQAANEIKTISKNTKSEVAFGFSSLIATTILLPMLRDFRRENPKAKIKIKEAQMASLLPGLRDGSLDFAIASLDNQVPSNEFVIEPLFKTPFAIAVRKGHHLEHKTTLKALANGKWLLPETDIGFYGQVRDKIFKHINHDNYPPLATESTSCILNLIKNDDYLGIFTVTRLMHPDYRDQLSIIPIKDALPLGEYGVVYLKKKPLSHTAKALIKQLHWHAKNYDWCYPQN